MSNPARREVLARLLKPNHDRYAEEVAQGLHEKKARMGGGGRDSKKEERQETTARVCLRRMNDDERPARSQNRS